MKKVFTIIAVLIFLKMSYAQNIQGTSDTAAIRKILNSFTQSIIKKDSATLASLFANTPIAFLAVRGAETVAYLRVSLKTHYFKLNKVFCGFFEFSLLATFSFLHHLNT